jgi:signal transduction histidine kinase
LTNATKHAQASGAHVSCRESGARLLLQVADDGTGGAVIVAGGGLSGLRDRVRALGGELIVDSPPAAGTRVRMELPCR